MNEQHTNLGQQAHLIKERAAATTSEAAGMVKRHVSDLGGQAQDRIEQAAEVRKASFADDLQNLGRAFERSGEHVRRDGGSLFTEPLQQVAQFCQQASQSLRDKSPRELFAEVEDFGRRQPAAFLGIALAAGFLATRLLRSDPQQAADSDTLPNSNRYSYEGRH